MGKLLSLGTRLKYPIIINKLLKRPGDDVKKEEAILQYKFTWTEMVGDPLTFGEQWEKTRTTIADWDSPADGKIAQWRIQEGMSIDRDMVFVEIEESCPHSVQFAGLCGMCGKDMTEMSWSSREADTDRAKINMIHDQTFLTVSESEASKAEEELQRRLLKHKKLSLVVDLDQTIIHACIEPTVGEWQRDVNSPNYEAVKDVRSFQLNDDGGPRGIASGCWYYIKMRPGLKEFLAHVSELYELHVYTMGTRAYAVEIAKIVDPDKKLFGERIISRDENGNVTAKSLARLFPVDTKMVVIIDDRADVWPKNRPNLIKVVPYDFFLGIGDINSSFLPKREDIPKASVTDKKRTIQKIEAKESESTGLPSLPAIETFASTEATDSGLGKEIGANDLDSKAENKVSALEELVSMGGGNDQALRLEQAAEQEKFLEKQLTERPLLHLQEELDKKDNEEVGDVAEEVSNGDTSHEQAHHRHNLLRDDDVELEYLEKHLTQLHKAFYEEYDSALKSAQGGRIAQLKPGHNKKVPIKENAADLKIVPDIGQVMPRLKARTLAGTTIVLSGLVPLGVDIKRSEIGLQAMSFGANIQTKVTKKVTHVVASTNRTRTAKVRQAAKYPHIKIVDQRWLLNSMSKWEKEDEEPYLVQIHQEDRRKGDALDVPSSMEEETDDDNDASGSSSEDADNEDNAIPASQEESDDEGVMPANMEGGVSPIDNLQGFDWDNVDDELAEFLGSDTENESDTGSVASDTSHGSNNSTPGRKRKHEEATDDDDSDTGTAVIRKRKRANDRGTGLKTVKTPNSGDSESSLPTPGVTGDENDEDATDQPHDDGDELDDDDLEAELEAAFEAEAQEAALNSAVDGHDGGG